MPLSDRENYLRTASMTGGEWIPMRLVISGAEWDMWREDLEEVVVRHPTLFPGFKKGERDYDDWDFGRAYRKGEDFTDNWGCVWHSEIDGIGWPTGAPLMSSGRPTQRPRARAARWTGRPRARACKSAPRRAC